MREDRNDIDRILGEAAACRRRGDYRAAARFADEAYRRSGPEHGRRRCLAALEAARGSYGLARFDECRRRVAEARDLAGELDASVRRRIDVESSILLANVHRRRSEYRKALDLLERLDGLPGVDAPGLVAERLLVEGACLFYLNREEEAERRLESALGLATHHAHAALQSRILAMISLLALNRGLTGSAAEYARRALRICREGGDAYGEAAAALNLALTLTRRGEFAEAKRHATTARRAFAAVGWRAGHCRATLALGIVRSRAGDARGAVGLFRKAERLAAADGYRREECIALCAMGGIRLEQGMLSKADRMFRRCLDMAMAFAPGGDMVAEANRRIGQLFLARGAAAPAVVHLRKAANLARELRDRRAEGVAGRLLGLCYLNLGDVAKAMSHFDAACGLLRRAGCLFDLAETRVAVAEAILARLDDQDTPAADLDGAWGGVLEAMHLLEGMDAEILKKRAGELLGILSARRRTAAAVEPDRRTGMVEIRFSDEYLIADRLVAASDAMLGVLRQIRFAASFERPVLVTGETGTGKELVARTIHESGDRRDRPFVAVNCAAIPDHLFESEFFGHRKGSFTGAFTDRTGIFEEAAGGTLFLDEVGELSTLQQVKLLRILQEGRVRRLGENVERPVDVRIISATNRELERKIEASTFREDFYYRINAEHIHLPPLRTRPEDVMPLVSYFLCGRKEGRETVRVESGALRRLQRYSWPGNVRELFTVLDRVRHLGPGGVVTMEMLPARLGEGAAGGRGEAVPSAGAVRTTDSLRKALSMCNGNKTAAARWLGISRGTLYKELRRAGLSNLISGPRTA